MKARLQIMWLDIKRSWPGLLLSVAVVYAITAYVLYEYTGKSKAWRFGFLLLEIGVPILLLWPLAMTSRWFGEGETESLRTARIRYSCAPSVAAALILEAILLFPSVLWGIAAKEALFWPFIKAYIFIVLLSAVYYFLSVLLKDGTLPLAATVAYCMFCTMFGKEESLKKFCLYYPAESGVYVREAVLPLLPWLAVAAVLLAAGHILEKKRAWME